MKIKVYAPIFGNTDALDDSGCLELAENATLNDVFKKMKIPFLLRNSLLCMVNYERGKSDRKLSEGDIISFIGPLSGG
ncbi:MoaD/ThiS family protein [bacterium]|nr:MoaD/ThiS family protein [bacterium]